MPLRELLGKTARAARMSRQRLIITFLVSYVAILLIPLLISSLVYSRAVRMITENTFEANLSLLEQSKDAVDRRLNEVENIAHQIAMDPRTSVFLERNEPLDSGGYYDITKYISQLKNFWIINNDLILDFIVYFRKMDAVVTSKTFYSLPEYYGNYFSYGGLTSEEFRDNILDMTYSAAYLPEEEMTFGEYAESEMKYRSIAFLQSLPIGRFGSTTGIIIVFIDANGINSLFRNIETGTSGCIYVTDRSGRLIIGQASQPENITVFEDLPASGSGHKLEDTPAGNMMVTYTTSSRNGWKYVSVLPSSEVMAKAAYIKRLIWMIVAAALVSGLVAAYFLAARNTRPIKRLAGILKDALGSEAGEEKNEFLLLQSNIGKMIRKNDRLLDIAEKQAPLIRAAFIAKLFRGGFNNIDELRAAAASAGMDIKGQIFEVVVIRINGYAGFAAQDILNELNFKKLILRDYMTNRMRLGDYFYDVSENKLAWLNDFSGLEGSHYVEYTDKTLRAMHDTVRNEFGMKLSFAAGSRRNSLLDVWHSFSEADRTMDEFLFDGREEILAWSDRINKESDRYYYGMDAAQKLINLVRSGDSENTKAMLDALYTENFINRKLSPRMARIFFKGLEGTLVNLSELLDPEAAIGEVLGELDKDTVLEDLFGRLADEFLRLCETVNSQKKSHNTRLKEKILEHINTNFQNTELCLCSVSSEAGLSETYLSQFFKEQTGENFAAYLEKMRIGHACVLLCRQDLPVGEVAGLSGYNSDHVFRRAFRRVMGMSPSEFKALGGTGSESRSGHI